ncbi:MAG: hypothetical protein AMJ79_03360 [Phycisphaerae bacterium SM23_30]|nr:MAG: hypothetical protein AMJ79_03360 [Phycisphaerae bacterium SM23_30]
MICLFLTAGCGGSSDALLADIIFVNGHIVTMDENNPEVEAMAVRAGKIIAVGTTEEMERSFFYPELVDLKGKTLMPGIIESHGHLLTLGESFLKLNVMGVETPDEVVEKVKEQLQNIPTGQWLIGWGWDDGAWADNYPTNEKLNAVSPDNPTLLNGLHGFALWANDKALEIAGITKDTPNPPNGIIFKDVQTGRPTGILKDQAQQLLTKYIPPLSRQQLEEALRLAIDECVRYGCTSVHEAKTSGEMVEVFKNLKKKDELKSRIYVMLDGADAELIDPYLRKGPVIDPDHMLTIRCIKIFVDGALGSRGAAMLKPYSDAPEETGEIVTTEDELYSLTKRALQKGLQMAIHAIGDRGNRITLNAFRRALKEVPKAKDHRLRLEHAQVVALEDISQFAPLGVVLSMQPPHATSDMGWAETRVGPERIKGAYAWRSFADSGVHLTLNSDFPGETLNPFYGMYAALTRQSPEGEPAGGWYPEQCLTREEVLRGYTVEAAYSGFEEGIKGQIKPGMLADLIVLSDDILMISPREFLSLEVEQTYLGGKLVYEKEK